MHAYRITKTRYLDGRSAEGAKLAGARFNSVGNAMLYLASSEVLALLEVRVHTPERMPDRRRFHVLGVPEAGIATLEALGLALPADWRAVPIPASTQALGDAWLASNASLALHVPSVVSTGDLNILVNPGHPDFADVIGISTRIESLDARLWSA